MNTVDPLYVAARRVLLDALEALAPHGDAVVIVGAQAIYLRTGDGDLTVAPYTTDGDLALDPSRLTEIPALEQAMGEAGFCLQPKGSGHVEPGIWLKSALVEGRPVSVAVDLIVPEGASPPGGSRGARLGTHGKRAARRAVGLEAALVDNSVMSIVALDPLDPRSMEALVAGAAALLVAKLHKLHDRVVRGREDRLHDKDAADVVRLMQATTPNEMAVTLAVLAGDVLGGPSTLDAMRYLDELFGRRGGPGIEMAANALRIAVPKDRVSGLCIAYAGSLLKSLDLSRLQRS
jgi:hypothetical protein